MVRRRKDPMPERVSPMLCTLVKEVPKDEDYIFEIKWDGYRIISSVNGKKVRMDSRNGLDYTKKYPPVARALRDLGHDAVIDGEVVVFNDEGNPDFDALQLYNGHNTPIKYCVFDLLWLDGHDLTQLPLVERKELLKMLVKEDDVFRFSESFDDGPALYQEMLKRNLEGIVAKAKSSVYEQGVRGPEWLKVPTRKRQEFVIGGWAESEKVRSFRSLLFGAYEDGVLKWIGRSGGGYKEKEMPDILKKLKALEIDESPFANKVLDTKGAKMHWVKPELVANFEFATWTKTGRIRKPATFLGFRKDKKARQVVREVPKTLDEVEDEESPEETDQADKQPEALSGYYAKRHFSKTPEPTGGKATSDHLAFVVQKHHASHLHYDFSLEMRGVLKSWAVPKGPSMNPEDHRLAMAVEDHPFDYKDFEGIIPEGQYGDGTVIIWDQGTYEPAEKIKGKKEQEHWLLSGYYKGVLSIVLKGKKLKGRFNLVRSRQRGDNAWLLTKAKDGKELKRDITNKGRSVVSDMTIEEMRAHKGARIWNSNRDDGSDETLAQQPAAGGKLADLLAPGKRFARGSNWRRLLDQEVTSTDTVELDNTTVLLTNVEINIWKDVNKAALIQYYHEIAETILPYLQDRPLSLHLKPHGAIAEGMYIKDMEGMQPEAGEIFTDKRRHPKPGKSKTIDYLVCNNEATLIYLVNLGCIDFNPWMSRISSPELPDFISIDLDPSDQDFEKVIAVAVAAKKILTAHKLKSFPKTSGKTGLHIYIPVSGISHAQARSYAENIGNEIHKQVPRISTTEISIDKRGSKVFIDYTMNDYADTLASAYSARPYKNPTVSTPLDWREVKPGLDPAKFTIDTIPDRLKKKGDLFLEALNKKWAEANTKRLLAM